MSPSLPLTDPSADNKFLEIDDDPQTPCSHIPQSTRAAKLSCFSAPTFTSSLRSVGSFDCSHGRRYKKWEIANRLQYFGDHRIYFSTSWVPPIYSTYLPSARSVCFTRSRQRLALRGSTSVQGSSACHPRYAVNTAADFLPCCLKENSIAKCKCGPFRKSKDAFDGKV